MGVALLFAGEVGDWMRLHPHNIEEKVKIIVEHFRTHIAGQIGGRAKVMVVAASRKEAVRFKLAMEKYIRAQGYVGIGVLVAFSGEVHNGESGSDPFSERNMNPDIAPAVDRWRTRKRFWPFRKALPQ